MIPQTPRTSEHLVNWCAAYQASDIVTQPPHIRYSIGIYQISQGMQWRIASDVKYQSFCAAAMHFTMSAHGFGIDLGSDFPERLDDFPEGFHGKTWETMLLLIGKTQQQVCYSDYISKNSARKSRFDPNKLRILMSSLIYECFALVPPARREQCCFDEMHILTKDIKLPEKLQMSTTYGIFNDKES